MHIFGMDITYKELLAGAVVIGALIAEIMRRTNKSKESVNIDSKDTKKVNQSGSIVSGDQIGRDKTTITN